MSEQNRSNRGTVRIAGAVAVLVILGALAAVYVNGAGSGNTSAGLASVDAGGTCSGSVALAQAIQPFARGQVAAMASASEPKALTSLAFNSPDDENMSLDELQAQMGGENFEVVAINIDTGDDVKPKKFLDEIGVESLGFYRDNTMGVFNDLKKEGLAFGLPVTLLVDEKGCLIANMNGPAHWSSDDAKTYIGKALEGSISTPSG